MDRRLMAATALHRLLPSPPTDGGEGGAGGGGAAPADQGQQQGDQGQTGGEGGGDAGGGAGKGGKGGKGGDGGQQQAEAAWYDRLPDTLKNDRTIQRHAKLEDAITALIGAEKRLGVPADQLIRLPTNDEETKALYAKLGAPETPDGYKIELGEGATDADKALATDFAKAMHEAGPFPPAFLKAAVDFMNAKGAQQAASDKAADETAEAEAKAELQKAWGADYEPRSKDIGLMLMDEKLAGGQELLNELTDMGFGKSLRLARFLGEVAAARREPGGMEGEARGTQKDVLTPAAAKAKRLELENDPVKGKAFRDPTHPQHKQVIAERDRYFAFEAGRNPDNG